MPFIDGLKLRCYFKTSTELVRAAQGGERQADTFTASSPLTRDSFSSLYELCVDEGNRPTDMPGAGKQSAEVQNQIIEFLRAGINPTTIHKRLRVGRSSVYRMKRCLEQHGTAYAPVETNKKNGRPKVMTLEQEQEVRDWLRDKDNQEKYLDDLVWFIHDRFGMVCSTTTCSKLKRKWIKVIEAEERGEHLDPDVAQEQVRHEAIDAGKRAARQRRLPSNDGSAVYHPAADPTAGQHARPSDLLTQDMSSDLPSKIASAALRAV